MIPDQVFCQIVFPIHAWPAYSGILPLYKISSLSLPPDESLCTPYSEPNPKFSQQNPVIRLANDFPEHPIVFRPGCICCKGLLLIFHHVPVRQWWNRKCRKFEPPNWRGSEWMQQSAYRTSSNGQYEQNSKFISPENIRWNNVAYSKL